VKDIIDNLKLEKLLVANWANFLDQKKLIAYTLMCVSNHEFGQSVETDGKLLPNVKITISHFQLKKDGFNLWIEYSIPMEQNVAIGTVELRLSNGGDLSHIQTIGTLFK
tara:strand:- start:161 stop:487 length:327 start_codon:yes stop_codon:yes gene_type:complete